jgi:hypothetical protein
MFSLTFAVQLVHAQFHDVYKKQLLAVPLYSRTVHVLNLMWFVCSAVLTVSVRGTHYTIARTLATCRLKNDLNCLCTAAAAAQYM